MIDKRQLTDRDIALEPNFSIPAELEPCSRVSTRHSLFKRRTMYTESAPIRYSHVVTAGLKKKRILSMVPSG